MSDEQKAEATLSVPAPAPSAVQAPATPAVPVETQKAPVTPAPQAPVAPVAPPTEQLLQPVIPKPTVEALKLPKEHLVPKETLDAIVSQSKTVEEAQSRFDLTQGLYADGVKRLQAQKNQWLQELKGDAELGGQKWEETIALYNSGMRRMFPEKAIKAISELPLEAMPDFVRGIVKAERAAGAKPIVKGEATPPPKQAVKAHEVVYGPDKDYDPTNPRKAATPRF